MKKQLFLIVKLLVLLLATGAFFGIRTAQAAFQTMDKQTYEFAKARVEEVRRQTPSKMPDWLKKNRDICRDWMFVQARNAYETTGLWFFARSDGRPSDAHETYAIWLDALSFVNSIEDLPYYSEENRKKAIEFWRSCQNLETGKMYNPLYRDPQNPKVKRHTPGNRKNCSGRLNPSYVAGIVEALGGEMPIPPVAFNQKTKKAKPFDVIWSCIQAWHPSPGGAKVSRAIKLLENNGDLDAIPQVEVGVSALVRAISPMTGMFRPEPLKGFPWRDYGPSSGFKIISRICGYVGMENFPKEKLHTAIDNLIEHKAELHDSVATARNYGETMAHYLVMTDYRRDEILDAMELCLEGFRDPKHWTNTRNGCYCVFGSGMIGAFMNWEDMSFKQAMPQFHRFEHGCKMKWRIVAGPYGNWANVMPKEPEAIYGNPKYDAKKYNLKARNKTHWAKEITDVTPQQDVALKMNADGKTGEGTFTFTLTKSQLAKLKAPYLKATWSGAYDVSLNGEPVKQVRYNLPDVPAGWYVPVSAAKTLHVGENTVTMKLLGPGKEQKPGAPLSKATPFIRLGVIDWRLLDARKTEKPVVIGVLADNRGGNSASDPPGGSRHRELMEMIRDDGAEAILNLGDMVYPIPRMGWSGFMDDMNAVFGERVDEVMNNYWLTAGGWEEQYINQRGGPRELTEAEWNAAGYAGQYAWPGDEPDNGAGLEFYNKRFHYKSRAGKPGENILDYDQFGDYHVCHRGVHILSLYISDEWHVPRVFGPHDDLPARKAAWEKQVLWFRGRLAEIRKNEPNAPIIAMAHDRDWLIQEGETFCGRLCAAMREYKVDLALCGDGHHFAHWPDPVTLKFMVPIPLVTAPGSGYFRVTIGQKTIKLEHRDTKGNLLKTFQTETGYRRHRAKRAAREKYPNRRFT